MNKVNILLVIALMGLLSSCVVLSLQPFYTDKDITFNGDLLGEWSNKEEKLTFTFDEHDSSAYAVEFSEEGESGLFQVHLFTLHSRYYLDFYPKYKGTNDFHTLHLIPGHTLIQCHSEKNKLILSPLDYEWVQKSLESGQLKGLRYEKVDGRIILTSSAADLQKFIITYEKDKNAFPEGKVFIKKM